MITARVQDPVQLKEAMAQAGFSQRALAKAVGCSTAAINHLVTGRMTTCSPGLADRIEEVVGVEAGTLFARTKYRIVVTKVAA